ncbi:MAG: thiopurine S-methyltransferase [Zoogloeaceae bacterium]|nr:thiopurine S-methyltransferase [Zoogloeaceae bacterium]
MDADFWHHKWANNEIGFHESAVNPFLVRHVGALGLAPGSRMFLPLCGKTLDIHWLLSQDYRVVGAELSRVAVLQLFDELGVEPEIAVAGPLERFSALNLDVFVGDIFDVSRDRLGPVDAVYDRAALVALPPEMRGRYAAHLMAITDQAPQLLICFEYDQALMAGPPFALLEDEVALHYGKAYTVTRLEQATIPGGFKGRIPATESVWLLTR